jgi:hypothetical protein
VTTTHSPLSRTLYRKAVLNPNPTFHDTSWASDGDEITVAVALAGFCLAWAEGCGVTIPVEISALLLQDPKVLRANGKKLSGMLGPYMNFVEGDPFFYLRLAALKALESVWADKPDQAVLGAYYYAGKVVSTSINLKLWHLPAKRIGGNHPQSATIRRFAARLRFSGEVKYLTWMLYTFQDATLDRSKKRRAPRPASLPPPYAEWFYSAISPLCIDAQ